MMNMDPVLLQKEMSHLIIYLVVSIPVLIIYLWLSKKARREWLVLMGQLKPKTTYEWDRREYVRMDTIFPVEFQKMDEGKLGPLHEAFTKDISKKGMQLEIKTLHGKRIESFIPTKTKVKLSINVPIYAEPIEATGIVRWVQKLEGAPIDRYLLGIAYESISEEAASRIIKYALWLHRKPAFLTSVVVVLVLIIALLGAFLSDLRTARRQLHRKIEEVSEEQKILVEKIKESRAEKKGLDDELLDKLIGEPPPPEKVEPLTLPPIHEEEVEEEEIFYDEEELEKELEEDLAGEEEVEALSKEELEDILKNKDALLEKLKEIEEEKGLEE